MKVVSAGGIRRIQDNLMVDLTERQIREIQFKLPLVAEGKLVSAIPRIQAIELTNYCNLKCIMCPHQMMTRKKGLMKKDLFFKIVDRDLAFPQTVELQMFGESTMHPQIQEMVGHLKAKGHRAVLSTNATLLQSKELCEKLMGLDVLVLSVDGIDPASYEKVRVGANFKHILEAVYTFTNVNRQNGYPVYTILQLIDMEETERWVAGYPEFWSEFLVQEIRVKRLLDSFAGEVNLDQTVTPKHWVPCGDALSGVAVRWDGKVSPCCRDFDGKVTLGDLNVESLVQIWSSWRAMQFRYHIQTGKNLSELCSGCREFDLVNLRFLPEINNPHFRGGDIRIGDIVEDE